MGTGDPCRPRVDPLLTIEPMTRGAGSGDVWNAERRRVTVHFTASRSFEPWCRMCEVEPLPPFGPVRTGRSSLVSQGVRGHPRSAAGGSQAALHLTRNERDHESDSTAPARGRKSVLARIASTRASESLPRPHDEVEEGTARYAHSSHGTDGWNLAPPRVRWKPCLDGLVADQVVLMASRR